MKSLFVVIMVVSLFVLAKTKEHRHHEAHVHGGATLNIAFDQLAGKIEFKAAADGIVGFEHAAKSKADQKTLADSIALFESKIGQMIVFDSGSGCVFEKDKIAMLSEKNSTHADFIANFKVQCSKSLSGTKLTLDFTSFNKINDLDVTVLIDSLQKTAEIKTKPITIDLK